MNGLDDSVLMVGRRLSKEISITAQRVSRYLEDTDLQEEVAKRLKSMHQRILSCPSQRAMDRSNQRNQSSVHDYPRRMSMFSVSSLSSPLRDVVNSPFEQRKWKEESKDVRYKVDYREMANRRYSSISRGESSVSGTSSTSSGFDGGLRSPPILNTIPAGRLVDCEAEGKEGKLFVSTEFSSSEKHLFVSVTQRGNVTGADKANGLRVCFSQILDNIASKKVCRSLEKTSNTNDFSKTYTYTVRFDSYEQMVNSGITVRLKLKSYNAFKAKKTLKTMDISLVDVEEDPVWLSETLFF